MDKLALYREAAQAVLRASDLGAARHAIRLAMARAGELASLESYPLGDSVMGRRVYCERGEFRPPMAGEYYLSGAIVEVWRAPNDLSQAFRIVRPIAYAKRVTAEAPGDPFQPGYSPSVASRI